MIGVSSSQAVWYLTRGTGTVSLMLLTSVTVLGIMNAVRWSPGFTPRFVVQRVHRNLSLLSVVFIVIHIATAVIDGFAPIRWIDAVVPFRSAYRPLWLGFGAVAFDLLIAVALTSLIRARLGYRVWRAVHWTSYALWGVAVFHGLGIGSDSKQLWMLALVVASVSAVVAAAVWRVAVGWPSWTPRPPQHGARRGVDAGRARRVVLGRTPSAGVGRSGRHAATAARSLELGNTRPVLDSRDRRGADRAALAGDQ